LKNKTLEDKTIEARDKVSTLEKTEIWKVRQVKPYENATNHIFLGRVISKNATYVAMDCVTFHFGKVVDTAMNNKVITGMRRIRRIPWHQIEVVHDLVKNFDYVNAEITTDKEGTVVFRTKDHDCIITKRTDRLK